MDARVKPGHDNRESVRANNKAAAGYTAALA